MLLGKRAGESVRSGVLLAPLRDFPVEDCEKENAFARALSILDKNFEYDGRVLLPTTTLRTTSRIFNGDVNRASWRS